MKSVLPEGFRASSPYSCGSSSPSGSSRSSAMTPPERTSSTKRFVTAGETIGSLALWQNTAGRDQKTVWDSLRDSVPGSSLLHRSIGPFRFVKPVILPHQDQPIQYFRQFALPRTRIFPGPSLPPSPGSPVPCRKGAGGLSHPYPIPFPPVPISA